MQCLHVFSHISTVLIYILFNFKYAKIVLFINEYIFSLILPTQKINLNINYSSSIKYVYMQNALKRIYV